MKVSLTAAAILLLLIASVPARADTGTTTFEPPGYALGSINGQNGWKVGPGPPSYDQAVVANGASVPAAFGLQSLRLSNAVTSGEFFFQTYSRPVTAPAREDLANTVFTGEFSFFSRTPGAEQTGLALSVSPDSGEGSRMAYVRLADSADGIRVYFDDVPFGYVNPDHHVLFAEQHIATLDRAVPHTIRFEIKLVAGQDNDVVRVYVDGVAKACGTTWENYYRYDIEQQGGANKNTVPPIDRMQFRSSGSAVPALSGQGFLFDNVTITTADSGGPEACETAPVVVPAVPPATSTTTTVIVREPGVTGRLIGNTVRILHAQLRKGERFLSARATLRNKRLPVRGRRIIVDLRGKVVGNYNVYIVAKYRTKRGKLRVVREMRSLSVTRALRDAPKPAS